MYKQKGESIKAKNMGSLREQRFLLLFVLFLTTVTSSTSSSRKLCLELLLIFESRVGLLDNAGFGFNHFLLHPRSGRHHVSEHSRLLLIATTHRPRWQTDQDVTAIGTFASQRRSPINLKKRAYGDSTSKRWRQMNMFQLTLHGLMLFCVEAQVKLLCNLKYLPKWEFCREFWQSLLRTTSTWTLFKTPLCRPTPLKPKSN